MWYPPTVTSAPASEPVTSTQFKAQAHVDHTDDDTLITRLITAGRSYVEAYTGLRLVTQTVTVKCDEWCDVGRIPVGPVASISSVSYVDGNGDTQTLATSVYEVRIDGLDASLVLKYGQSWPAIRYGSRITVTAVLGYTTIPEAIVHAILLCLTHWYENREAMMTNQQMKAPHGVDDLLTNFRLGV